MPKGPGITAQAGVGGPTKGRGMCKRKALECEGANKSGSNAFRCVDHDYAFSFLITPHL